MTPQSKKKIFEDFCNTHYRYVTNFMRFKFGISDAELPDLTQEVLLYINTKLNLFEGRSSFKTWASSVILNYCKNKFRYNAAQKRQHYDIRADISDLIEHNNPNCNINGLAFKMDFSDKRAVSPLSTISYKRMVKKVNECLSKINARHAEIFRLKVFGDLKYKQIAKELNINPLTAKTGFNRARKHIAKRLIQINYV